MRLPPADVLLSWPSPNYENPVTRGNALVIVNCIFISITIVTVALRLYTRAFIKRWFGIDDIFIILALVRKLVFILRYESPDTQQIFTIGLTAVVLLANQRYGWVSDQHHTSAQISLADPVV
jgi:uncharacterized membrane protein